MRNSAAIQLHRSRASGMTLVETLVALVITAVLMAAVVMALNASFNAYAASAEQSSSQATTRMVTERILQLIRTGTVQGPTNTSTAIVASTSMYMLDANNQFMELEYQAGVAPAPGTLWLYIWPAGTIPSNSAIASNSGCSSSTPILNNVTACVFSVLSRQQNNGVWVVQRGTMDLTIQPPADATLSLENGASTAFRVIASTMPRKLQSN